jgi:hypothetical protein
VAACPHRFSTGVPKWPVDFLVENFGSKCDRLFLLHSRWIALQQVMAGYCGRAG